MPPAHPALTRRGLLLAAAATPPLLAAGCTLGESGRPPEDQPEDLRAGAEEVAPDVELLAAATAEVAELVTLFERAVRQQRGLAPQLRPLLRVHQRHADVLGAADTGAGESTPPPTSQSAPRSATAPADDGTTAEPTPLPRQRPALLSLLAAAEQRAAAVHLRQVGRAESGQFARLLASISAAESQHATVLEEAAG